MLTHFETDSGQTLTIKLLSIELEFHVLSLQKTPPGPLIIAVNTFRGFEHRYHQLKASDGDMSEDLLLGVR